MWKRIVGGFFYLALCALLLGMGSALGWIGQSKMLKILMINRGKQLFHIPTENPFQGKDTLTLLVLGCDEDRYFGGEQITRHQARSDMILLCKLDFKNKRISGISIPRDTLVAADGHRAQKINAYHVMHGNNLLANNDESRKAVEELLQGVQIDRVMALNFDSFKEMVDAVGGVDIFVPKNMNYDDDRGHLHIHLKSGRQHLDGDKAEQFVRFRHSDSDFARTERQRDFVLAFKDAVKNNWTKLPTVAEKAVDLTGRALSDEEVAYVADFAEKIGSDNIEMGLLPTVDANDGEFDLKVDEAHLDTVLRKYHLVDGDTSNETVSLNR